MKISRDQYEAWFLDYLEGNLEESMTDDFRTFLQENPDLAEELELYEKETLSPPDVVFPHRNALYKQPFDLQEIFDYTAVGMLEGDLPTDTLLSFETWLKEHPAKSQEMDLFRKTRLIPEEQLVLKNKQSLYHSTRHLRITPFFLLKIAALFLLVMLIPVISEKNRYVPLPETENTASSSVFQNHSENIPESNPANITVYASAGQNSSNLPEIHPVKAVEKKMEKNPVTEDHTLLAATGRVELPSLLPSESKSDPFLLKSGEPQLIVSSVTSDLYAQIDPEEIYLSDKLARKIGLNGLNMGKVVRWGLTLASGLSKGKFNYATSESGDIIALNLDTRLLGFSIPVNEK